MDSTVDEDKKVDGGSSAVALCASCDRCRSRKTKCDGKRPCGNCASKYMKKHKLTSIEGIDLAEFECVYSPAKRRGPIPGRSSGQVRKASEMQTQEPKGQQQQQKVVDQQQQQATLLSQHLTGGAADGNASAAAALFQGQAAAAASGGTDTQLQQQLNLLQQLQQQQLSAQGPFSQQLQQQQQQQHTLDGSMNHSQQQQANQDDDILMGDEPAARRVKRSADDASASDGGASNGTGGSGIPRTIMTHTHLLERSSPEGSRLRAYYKLSIDELYRLPPTPTDEEYCTKLNLPGITPQMIPGSHLAALSAARFSEVALGALVHNEVSLAMELCNAVVHCLRESVQETVQKPVMFEVAKAYFLLGVFRAYRGDMERYFKYRRVCMTYLSKLEDDSNSSLLLAAVSYLDSWAYMVYNANEKDLPSVDDTIPCVGGSCGMPRSFNNHIEMKYDIKTDPSSVACDPGNQNWIQGAPPVYLNNEAPLNARALDALACAVRTCCDQANKRFATIAKEANQGQPEIPPPPGDSSSVTPTTTAVMAHENELCSRNLVLSAYILMQQHESSGKGRYKNEGQHLIISAMDAFLENSDEEGGSGFTDSQVQSLLSVCNTAVENPFLLHHAGPTYHMISNAAILLCHLLNGMFAMKSSNQFGPMEATMFEEVLDTFISIRKLLTIHRRKLPVKLRCHGIPRPPIEAPTEGQPFVDLGETLLCPCRGCQGFVLMACSPCVAAERALKAQKILEIESAQEAEALEVGELDKELDDLGAEFNLDDDALLSMISNLISNPPGGTGNGGSN